MNDGQEIPPVNSANQQVNTPVVSLAPPPGGGSKPWIIMGFLVVAIGLALWAMSSMKKDSASDAPVEDVVKKEAVKRAKPRKAEKTGERPGKKEMAELSAKNREDFEKNVGKWVLIQGEVRSGDKDGLIVFKDPVKVSAQLVKGSAEHLTGQHVKVIGWLLSEEKLQIDGIFDITTIDPVDLLPKKDVYTFEDGEQLVALRNTRATFKGKVESVRVSGDKKNLYLIFEGEGYQFYGSGKIKTLKKDKVSEATLKELIGKTVKLKGKLAYQEMDGGEKRVLINFTEKDAFELVD